MTDRLDVTFDKKFCFFHRCLRSHGERGNFRLRSPLLPNPIRVDRFLHKPVYRWIVFRQFYENKAFGWYWCLPVQLQF